MRALTPLVIATLAMQGLTPVAANAQPREDRYATEACGGALQGEVRDQYPQAYGVRITNSTPLSQGRGEISVRGEGEFEDRNGGAARFDYSCVYDVRANRTYGLDVYNVRPKKAPGEKKDNSAAIAGLVLGAIVVGALVAGDKDNDRDRDRDRRREWSPEPGVRCNSREARCYKDGRYSERWTRRIFVR
ncbi:hypothetical protein [uncultured Phenylobacterium sp.]|uniref:hypothetical protein n=1 Tax=uncultured Phenylobacterium sp. TaxID=349273 RepID=UPI0025EAA563|nr:hypothetical protein [uncultured Phenylobacterium sp.]